MNGQITGPFYSGVSVVLNLSEFSIGFNTPTSTSKTKEIAMRFAGSKGMVMAVGNERGNSAYQPLFNATWVSAFVEEDEYFWFGSTDKLSAENINIVRSARVYSDSIFMLYFFDGLLSGEDMRKMKLSRKSLKSLKRCL